MQRPCTVYPFKVGICVKSVLSNGYCPSYDEQLPFQPMSRLQTQQQLICHVTNTQTCSKGQALRPLAGSRRDEPLVRLTCRRFATIKQPEVEDVNEIQSCDTIRLATNYNTTVASHLPTPIRRRLSNQRGRSRETGSGKKQ